MDLNSRKLMYAQALLISSTALLVGYYIDKDNWVDINKWVFGLYATGNVAGKFAASKLKLT